MAQNGWNCWFSVNEGQLAENVNVKLNSSEYASISLIIHVPSADPGDYTIDVIGKLKDEEKDFSLTIRVSA
jgi:uncharacterized membrane protein